MGIGNGMSKRDMEGMTGEGANLAIVLIDSLAGPCLATYTEREKLSCDMNGEADRQTMPIMGDSPILGEIIDKAHQAVEQLRVKSALNPMLWLCGIISLPCFVLAWLTTGTQPLSTILTWVGTGPVVITCMLAIYFAIFKADKLQSEEYQIRHETIELIKQKGSLIEISPSSLEVIASPVHRIGIRKE